MKWPLVSRRAYDLLLAERDRLAGWLDRELEHRGRLERVDMGLAELPRTEPEPAEPMPDELMAHIDGFADATIRAELVRHARAAYDGGRPWDQILEEMVSV
jgi:hypothetical protein